MAGLIVAVLATHYVFLKDAKLWDCNLAAGAKGAGERESWLESCPGVTIYSVQAKRDLARRVAAELG